MKRKKETKGKVIPKLHKIKSKKKKVEFVNLSSKRQFVVYRDLKGRVIPEARVKTCRRKVRVEIWRYSTGTKRNKRIMICKTYIKRKRLISKRMLFKMAKARYGGVKRKVKMINGEVYAFTGSP